MVKLSREALERDLLTLDELKGTLGTTIAEKQKAADDLHKSLRDLKENIEFLKKDSPIVLLNEYRELKKNIKILSEQARTLLREYEVLKTRLGKVNLERDRIVRILDTQFGVVLEFHEKSA